MTTIEALSIAAQIQVGTKVAMGRNCILEVTEIKKTRFVGVLIINGKVRSEATSLHFDTLLNPHYNKDISIIN